MKVGEPTGGRVVVGRVGLARSKINGILLSCTIKSLTPAKANGASVGSRLRYVTQPFAALWARQVSRQSVKLNCWLQIEYYGIASLTI